MIKIIKKIGKTISEEIMLSEINNDLKPTLKEAINTGLISKLNEYKDSLLNSKGQVIFYGPPGTGKTFIAKKLAQLITSEPLTNSWSTNDHRKIVQFHPSYSYEDFVQGIKPVKDGENITYKLQPGIFQKFCEITHKTIQSATGTGITPTTNLECAIFVLLKESGNLDFDEIHKRTMEGYQQHNYGPLSFSSSPNHSDNQRWVLNNDQRNNDPMIFTHPDRSTWGLNEEHPDYSKYKMKFSSTTTSGVDTDPKVLIIDEINRGNLSKIFGELIYALEYRNETIDLQYKEFSPGNDQGTLSIPKNLFLVGTMNTADRSIVLFDAALRRRFVFIPLFPDYDLLAQSLNIDLFYDEKVFHTKLSSATDTTTKHKILSVLALEKINKQLAENQSIGKEKQIGHTFLLPIQDNPSLFQQIWKQEILPLLEEYYFETSDAIESMPGFSTLYSKEKGILPFDEDELTSALEEFTKP